MPGRNLHTLTIEKLVPGGLGLGRLDDGIVVLVRYVLPGEKVLVRQTGRKKDYISANLIQVLAPSPDRAEPPCLIYGRCGGCDLQHAKPKAQTRLKKEIMADSLHRTAGEIFSDSLISLDDPLPAPEQFGYRQRIRLQVDSRGDYGFFQPGSHTLQPVSQCLLAEDELNAVVRQLHVSLPFNKLVKHCRSFELLFNPQENNTVMLLHFQRKPRPGDCLSARSLARETKGLALILMQVEGYGLYDPLQQAYLSSAPLLSNSMAIDTIGPDLAFTWEVGGFSQVNLAQNATLVKLVLELAAQGPHARILDLYCGYGNFSLPLAKSADEVLGIDAQNSAIRSAQRNAIRNGILNCRFEKQQVFQAVESLLARDRTFETIILDPPRQGVHKTIGLLPELGADRIIYISCDPATLARDLAILIPKGYQLSRLVPVDMFPQTHHLESVALLKRITL